MAEETKTAPAKTEDKKDDSGQIKVRLLAKLYEQPVKDSNGKVTGYNKFTQGALLYVDRPTFDALNEFKPSFEEVTD